MWIGPGIGGRRHPLLKFGGGGRLPTFLMGGGPPIGELFGGCFLLFLSCFLLFLYCFGTFSDCVPLFFWFLKVFLVFQGGCVPETS